MRPINLLLCLCTVTLLVSACASSGETPANAGTPALERPLSSPLLSPQFVSPSPVVPTPVPGMGSVRGALFVRENGVEVPVRGALLFLAPTVRTAEGVEVAVGLDRTSAPYAHTDENGNFYFYNVPPGRYGLVFDLLSQAFLLNRPFDGGDLIITVTADQTTSLDRLVYDRLPTRP